jgi:hypothetical protein
VWTNPATESLERRIWTVASPPPTQPFVLDLCGGEFGPQDLEQVTSLLSSGRMTTVIIDKYEVGGYEHDITETEINGALCLLAAHAKCIAVFAQFECGPWSALRCIQRGPPVLFDIDNLSGIKGPDGQILKQATAAKQLVDSGLNILRVWCRPSQSCSSRPSTRRGGS